MSSGETTGRPGEQNRELQDAEHIRRLADPSTPIHQAMGLPMFASGEQYHAAQRRLIKETHPDVNGTDDPTMLAAAQRVNGAVNSRRELGPEVLESQHDRVNEIEQIKATLDSSEDYQLVESYRKKLAESPTPLDQALTQLDEIQMTLDQADLIGNEVNFGRIRRVRDREKGINVYRVEHPEELAKLSSEAQANQGSIVGALYERDRLDRAKKAAVDELKREQEKAEIEENVAKMKPANSSPKQTPEDSPAEILKMAQRMQALYEQRNRRSY